ncbi:MAG: RusA family crossover junction endodeoxyribonuclease [Nitrospira sp.]|nr:RusA family crossover junction endodeoxyribonuclease [Nitrospira sp.]
MPPRQRRGIVFSSSAFFSNTSRRRKTRAGLRFISTGSLKPSADSLTSIRSNAVTSDHIPPHPAMVTANCLTLTLPVPPSINHQYATVNGRRLLSSKGRAYKEEVAQQVWVVLAQSLYARAFRDRLRSGPLALSIQFFFATSLRRDLDGGLKIAQDAVCEGLGVNDNRITETHLYKHVDKTNPRIEVSLSCLLPPPHEC